MAEDVGRSDSERSAALVARLSLVTLQAGVLMSALVPGLALASPLPWRDSGEGRSDAREGNRRCEDEREYSPHNVSLRPVMQPTTRFTH